jgi:hypothetical protein
VIQKVSKPGAGFRGALNYVLDPDKSPDLLAGNMAGESPRSLAREFGDVRGLNENVGKPVFHASLSAALADQVDAQQWRDIAEDYVRRMGYGASPWIAVRHRDTDHDHIHIIASRIDHEGKRVRDFQERKLGEGIARDLERDYGLQAVASSRDADQRAPGREEIAAFERSGQVAVTARLQEHLDIAARGEVPPTMGEFVQRLEAQGVQVRPHIASTGRVSGLSFELDGVALKGSDLGRAYSWQGLQQRTRIGYEPDRDLPVLKAAAERSARPALGSAPEPVQAPRSAIPPPETKPVEAYRAAAALTSMLEVEQRYRHHQRLWDAIKPAHWRARQQVHQHQSLKTSLQSAEERARHFLGRIYDDPARAAVKLDELIARRGHKVAAEVLETRPGKLGAVQGYGLAGKNTEARTQALNWTRNVAFEVRSAGYLRAQVEKGEGAFARAEKIFTGAEKKMTTLTPLDLFPHPEALSKGIGRAALALGTRTAERVLSPAAAGVMLSAVRLVKNALLYQARERERSQGLALDLGR